MAKTFVLGLLEKISYALGWGICQVYHEGNDLAYENYNLRPVNELEEQIRSSSARCIIFKAFTQQHAIQQLSTALHCRQIIWLYRHYDDVVRSHSRKWPEGRNQIDAIIQKNSNGGWRALGMSSTTKAVLRKYYHPDINNSSAQALFWYYRNLQLFEQFENSSYQPLFVDYDAMMREPVS